MMILKVKSNEYAFTIPIPYILLRMGIGILTSDLFQRQMKVWLNKHIGHLGEQRNQKQDFELNSSKIWIELILSILDNRRTKQAIRQLIKVLQSCKGRVLVDVQAQDGTEVLIRL